VSRQSEEEGGEEPSNELHISTGGSAEEAVMLVLVTYDGLVAPIKLYIQPLVPGLEDDLTQPPIPTGFMCQEP